MFDHVKLRALAVRAAIVQSEAKALTHELKAMLPVETGDALTAVIAGWPEEDRECHRYMLHALINLLKASPALDLVEFDLRNATVGVSI